MVVSKGFWNILLFSFIPSMFIVCKSIELKDQRSMILFFYYKQRVLLRTVWSSVCSLFISSQYHIYGIEVGSATPLERISLAQTNIKATMFMATFTFPFGRTNCVVGNRVDGNIAEKVRVQSSHIRSWCSCYLNNRIHCVLSMSQHIEVKGVKRRSVARSKCGESSEISTFNAKRIRYSIANRVNIFYNTIYFAVI